VATAVIILIAGYDTTGTTLAFAAYQLAKHPEIQERLREEVEEVCGEDMNEDISYDDLHKMTYLDQIISETLRVHNPAGVLQRNTLRDYKVPGHDFLIEKGTNVWINVMAVHMDPKHYANPFEFDPDHFSKEAKAARHQ
jgi:cytochrome P450